MVLKISSHNPVPDYKVINAILRDGTPHLQSVVPKATQASVQASIQALLSNVPARNEFVSALMNRIGRVIGRHISWDNPMAKFKIGMMQSGDTIEEIMTGLVESRVYEVAHNTTEKDLLAQERPEVQASFHKENRRDTFKFTINHRELEKAFREGDGFGLESFVAQMMSSATKSDALAEYTLMMSLFRHNYDNGGFFKVNVPDVGSHSSDVDDAKVLLRSIREFSNNLKFLSRRYNAAGMPVAAEPDELELFLPNAVDAALDVEALAWAFNVDRADVHSRKTVAPFEDFNIPGLQAVLTTRDFFVVADTYYEVTEFRNPHGRYTNHWLHHDQIISLSRFAPTILFTTEPATPIIVNDSKPTDLTAPVVYQVDDNDNETVVTEVVRGESYYVRSAVTLDNPEGMNDAVHYSVVGAQAYDTRLVNSSLIVSNSEASENLTISAIAVGDNAVKQTTVKVVSGDQLQVWPNPQVIPGTEPEPEPEPEG